MSTNAGDPNASPNAPTSAALQFDKVELTAPAQAAAATCSRCRRPVVDEYFALGRNVICPTCAKDLREGDGAGFLRALVLGGAAALLGTIAWFAIIKLTKSEFGLLAIGVGLFVGFAVRRGSRALGGWKFQVLAMVLTYGSITASYVPLVMSGLAGTDASLPIIVGIALASPFLRGSSNIMGIIIIGIALYEAWKMNRRIAIGGPFRLGGTPGATAPASPGAPPPIQTGNTGP